MIPRAILFFALLAVASVVAAWFVRNPGEVSMVWAGYRIDMHVGVLVAGVVLLLVAVVLVYRLLSGVARTPGALGRAGRARKQRQGYLALTRGMVAVAAGDVDEARRLARRAQDFLDEPPLTMLLSAQAAQLGGDTQAARRYFQAMLDEPDTELSGLRGLLTIAQRDGDAAAARRVVERARRLRPDTPWVMNTLFELQARARDWSEAEETLKLAARKKAMDRDTVERRTALVLLEQSRAAEERGDQDGALALARKARQGDAFDPAALQTARLLVATGRTRRAQKLIEELWSRAPHPLLARLYANTVDGSDSLRRLKHIEGLEALAPDAPETHLALAEAALDAKLWGQARRHITAALDAAPSAAGYRLMARLAEAEGGDMAEARAWLQRATDAGPGESWLCRNCGAVATDWSAVCGHCGAVDTIVWDQPPRVQALTPVAAEAAKEGAIDSAAESRAEPRLPPPAAGVAGGVAGGRNVSR